MNTYLKIKNWKLKIRLARKGFSIAEVIISLFVITVGLIAVLGLIASSVRESAASRNQIIGAELAQEGFELIRNTRDNNLLTTGDVYNSGLADNSNVCVNYSTDTAGSPNFICLASGNKLYYNSDGRYLHNSSSASETPFSRKIVIVNDGTAKTIIVFSKVWWGSSEPTDATCNSAKKCVLVQNSLTEHP